MNKWTRELEKLKQQPRESVDQYAASMHNPEDIVTVIELAQHYKEAEDLEEGLEPEESENEIKPKPKTKRKIKKKKYESESSDEETHVKKEKVKKKEVEVDPIEELTKKMNELIIKLAKTERPQYDDNNIRSRNYEIECYNCEKKRHIRRDCKSTNQNNNYRNNERNTPRNNFGNNNNQRRSTSNQFRSNRNNQNQTPAHYLSIEDGNEYETDEEDREIIAL
ncbi:hypothetical protein Glove_478g97 [Diversispora epigaea]|uniref:CCHC-type domain-containing protein n=1 Tax=Diversispora epigaea TaxID=1348612 RepID=A0A397GKC0_9GLOM|nr:hypothetical protein Glove_478g97 [Diversispora epigaea]